MKTRIYDTYYDFSNRENKEENGVSERFAELHANYEGDNEKNEACWNCSDCSRCSGCSDIQGARPVAAKESQMLIPVIPNIHGVLLDAVKSKPHSLEMGAWHTCGTTHCRAGWITRLAGEAGKKLEGQTSTEFAAMQIYKASSPIRVSPVRFYESNEVAMRDIKRCAEEEANLTKHQNIPNERK